MVEKSKTSRVKVCDPSPASLSACASDERLAALAWAVAHPARVRIVRLLMSRETCVCGEIVDQLPLAQSTVSQHLKILKESGLVQGEVDGPKVCYCINRPTLAELKRLIEALCAYPESTRAFRPTGRWKRISIPVGGATGVQYTRRSADGISRFTTNRCAALHEGHGRSAGRDGEWSGGELRHFSVA